ncbi:Uncharacterised protein [Burkholderia pseudomallei]|nr:Uncharacterised protein [Burkholderia pseudomallei]
MWRWMFSTTTIASSTTSPIASTIASSVSRFSEKPAASISAAEPTSDSGIVSTGMITARNEPRNRKITTTTIAIASVSVERTSAIDALTKRAPSNMFAISTLAGLLRSIAGSTAPTPRTISSGLPAGVALTAMYTARRPFISALEL